MKDNKDTIISLRLNDRELEELNSLVALGDKIIKEKWLGWGIKCTNSKMIRCLIKAISCLSEEEKTELINKHYSFWR